MSQPKQIGPYCFLAPLGQGGMRVGYRAQHESSGEVVAPKTVQVHDSGMLHNLRREIYGLAQLRHPGIVRVLMFWNASRATAGLVEGLCPEVVEVHRTHYATCRSYR